MSSALHPPATLPRIEAIGTRISRTYEPDDPELAGKRVTPFRLHELEHIPRDHRDIYDGLLRAMPEALFTAGTLQTLRETVKHVTGLAVDLWLNGLRVWESGRLRRLIPGATCILVVGLAPRDEKLMVEVDLGFVYRTVAELLGTQGRHVDIHRPLTEIEQGVFLYLVLKLMAVVQARFVHPEQVSLRVEDIRSDVRGCADIINTANRWLVLTFKLVEDVNVGAVRVLVPETMAKGIVLKRPSPDSQLARSVRSRIRERLKPFAKAPVDIWGEIGRIELTRSDLSHLEQGDIVVLEHVNAQLQDGAALGPAIFRVGLGRCGLLSGRLEVQNGQHVFVLDQIVAEETPAAHDPVQGHGAHHDPEGVVAEYEDHGNMEHQEGAEEHAHGGDYGDYDEGDDGDVTRDDIVDEDHGLDDEDDGDGDGEEYYEEEAGYEEGYGEGEGEGAAEGEYSEGEYQEGYSEGEYQEGYGEYSEGQDQADPALGGDVGQGQDAGHGAVAAPETDNLAEMEPLLGDIPMVVVVELGRVQLTADEVVRMRSGQLIELGRSPTDPVDLVVNGKLIAKGELVEIEGALGVKLVSIMKEGP